MWDLIRFIADAGRRGRSLSSRRASSGAVDPQRRAPHSDGMPYAGVVPGRREILRLGAMAGLGCVLPALGTTTAWAGNSGTKRVPGFGRAQSVILVFANGGQSHIDTWDPKPQAPEQVRGEFDTISTAVAGTAVCEHLPRMAALADRYAMVRSVSHDDLDHGSAAYLALSGHFHPRKSSNPPPRPEDFPTYGSVLQRVRPAERFPYTAVHVNGPAMVPKYAAPGQSAGFLGRDYDPMLIGDVSASSVSALPSLDPRPDVPEVRLQGRRRLLESIDSAMRQWERYEGPAAATLKYRQAFEVLASPKCRQAFDLSQEPDDLRDRYGRYRSGQACLLARRLVEAGVPWITVMFNHTNRGQDIDPDDAEQWGWDTHNDIFVALKRHLLPRFDQSVSTLLTDLEERGMLEDTLVVVMGEFGRAPLVAIERNFAGNSPGRKHWASAYSILFAGAGVQPGLVYGKTDRLGGHVVEGLVEPGDIAATMFSALGVDPAQHYRDSLDRPFPVATGRPITGLYSS